MKNYKNEKSLFVALLGCTICLMFTLMYLGGFKSLTYFLGSEAIYDFPETDMIKNGEVKAVSGNKITVGIYQQNYELGGISVYFDYIIIAVFLI